MLSDTQLLKGLLARVGALEKVSHEPVVVVSKANLEKVLTTFEQRITTLEKELADVRANGIRSVGL